jgi:hypothetical protein
LKDKKSLGCLKKTMQSTIVPYDSTDLASPVNREIIKKQLEALDQRLMSEDELRESLGVLKVFIMAFMQKVNTLEQCLDSLRVEQETQATRMETIYLQSKLEISSLRAEIKKQRLSKRRFDQVIKVAETLKDNPYAPYAIRGLLKETSNVPANSTHPTDFSKRLQFAQANGFRWNQNNRIPQKVQQQVLLVEKWEKEFCSVEHFTLDQLLNTTLVKGCGAGAIGGALLALESKLGYEMAERKKLSTYNCYLKAVKLCQTKLSSDKVAPVHSAFLSLFNSADHPYLLDKLSGLNLSSSEDYLRFARRVCTKTLLPIGISLAELQAADFKLRLQPF